MGATAEPLPMDFSVYHRASLGAVGRGRARHAVGRARLGAQPPRSGRRARCVQKKRHLCRAKVRGGPSSWARNRWGGRPRAFCETPPSQMPRVGRGCWSPNVEDGLATRSLHHAALRRAVGRRGKAIVHALMLLFTHACASRRLVHAAMLSLVARRRCPEGFWPTAVAVWRATSWCAQRRIASGNATSTVGGIDARAAPGCASLCVGTVRLRQPKCGLREPRGGPGIKKASTWRPID